MPIRVYVLNEADAAGLKKLLEYDPYLDPNLTPKIPDKWYDEEYLKKHPEIAKEAEEKKKAVEEILNNLKNSEEANIIFARQDYMLKDGISLGLDRGKYYLYLSAEDELLSKDELKLKKSTASLTRADPDTEKKVIAAIDNERQKSEEGLGFIFG